MIPNSDLYTGRLTVNTALDARSTSVPLTLPYGTDLEAARKLLAGAARGVEGLAIQPPPSIVVTGLTPTGVAVNLRSWVDSPQRRDVTDSTDRVLRAVNARLREAGVNLSPPQGVAVTLDSAGPLPAQVAASAGPGRAAGGGAASEEERGEKGRA